MLYRTGTNAPNKKRYALVDYAKHTVKTQTINIIISFAQYLSTIARVFYVKVYYNNTRETTFIKHPCPKNAAKNFKKSKIALFSFYSFQHPFTPIIDL